MSQNTEAFSERERHCMQLLRDAGVEDRLVMLEGFINDETGRRVAIVAVLEGEKNFEGFIDPDSPQTMMLPVGIIDPDLGHKIKTPAGTTKLPRRK